jgi:hypothetical protein
MTPGGFTRWWSAWCGALLAACASPREEVRGLADAPPLDGAVLVTGGAFWVPSAYGGGTFAGVDAGQGEAIAIDAVLDVLRRGRVFQRVELDPDPARRRRLRDQLLSGRPDDQMLTFLQQARADGFDLLLVVEELQDGPIENQGTNARWPVTFATWILLGVGALIPDRTFESRATLRVTLRELQSGRALYDPLLVAGPVELALTERTDFWGLLSSVLIPPFWVGDDAAAVSAAVRDTTERRLLLSMARELKSESARRRCRERSAASLVLVEADGIARIAVDALEELSVVRLQGAGIDPAAAAAFAERLLGAVRRDGPRYRYEAILPRLPAASLVQLQVGTLNGSVASATFAPKAGR